MHTEPHRTTQIKRNKFHEKQLNNSSVCIFLFCIYLSESVFICGKNSSVVHPPWGIIPVPIVVGKHG